MTITPDLKPSGRSFRQTIQSRLVLLLSILIIPILLVQAYVFHNRFQTRRAEELQANLEIARAICEMFEGFVQNVLQEELAIGISLTLPQSLSVEQMNEVLTKVNRESPGVRNFVWATPQGRSIASNLPGAIGLDITKRPHYQKIIEGQDYVVSDLYTSQVDNAPCFSISRSIRDDAGNLLGIVIAIIVPENLDQLLAIERAKGGGYALVDSRGILVYRYPAINATWEERNWLEQFPAFEEALKGKEAATTVYAPFEGKNRLVGFTPVPSIGWAASAGRTEEIAMAAITSTLQLEAVLFFLVTVAAFAIALVFSHRISTSVRSLRDHALALGRGATESTPIYSSPVEIKDLAEAFNTMANEVHFRENALRESEEHYRSLFDNMLNGYAYCKMHFEQNRPMDFTYLSVNGAFETLTGLKNVAGKRVSEVIPGIRSSDPELFEVYGRVASTGIPHAFETYVEALGMWFSISAYSPRKEHFVAVFDAITERKQNEEALYRSKSRFRLLSETAGRLLASQSPQGIVEGLCREVMKHLDCHAFFNFLVDEVMGKLHLNACAGIPEEEARKIEWLDYGVAVCGCAARDQERIVAEDIFNTPDIRTELVKSYGIQAYACHPLMVQGKLVGTLSFGTKTRTHFSPEDLGLMKTVADQVATAMEKVKLIDELRHSRDELEKRVQERTAELVNANETLRERAALLDLAQDAIVVRDMENRIAYWSRGAETTYSWARNETLGKVIHDLLDTKFPKPLEEIKMELLERGYWEGELRHMTRSGQTIVTDSRWVLQKDADGNPLGFLEINRDITERKRMEEAAKASHKFLEIANRHTAMASLLEEFVLEVKQFTGCGALAIRILDKEGNIPYAAQDGLSKRFFELESPLSIKTDHCMCINVVKGTTDPKLPFYTAYGSFYMNDTTRFMATVSEEDKGKTRNACNRFGYESVALIPIKAGNSILGLIHLADKEENKVPLSVVQVMEQVAMSLGAAIQRVEAEEAVKSYMKKLEQSNQALQDFSSIASHDLQEPLRKVTSFGNRLKQKYGETLAQEGEDYLDRMLGATSRMQSLLGSLLEYSRVATKAEPLREVNLQDIVREVLSDLEVRIEKTGGEIHVDQLPIVEADPTQMRQLFQNLIGNALKFHRPEEKPVIKVLGRCAPGHDGYLEICVEDNGIGFEEQYLDRIFAPFQRLHGRSSQFEGTGMGLAICKKIVERHGGSITAKSTPGKGTTFIVKLPIKQFLKV